MPEDGGGFAAGAEGGLKKRLGPLEIWQWGAGVVGLLALYLAYKAAKGGGTSTTASASPSVSTVPPSDIATTGANTAVTGQLTNITTGIDKLATQIAALPQQVTAVSAPSNSGGTSSPSGGGLLSLVGQGQNGQPVDQAGASYWQSFLSGHTMGQTFLAIEGTPQATSYAQSNPGGFVNAQYNQLLGHPGDAAGLAYWQGTLGSNPTQAQVTQESQAFLGSAKGEVKGLQ